MFLTYFLFIIGFFLLIKGADWLVDGSSSLAKKWGIPSLVIGLTIVSFGTSAPELIVNILASTADSNDLAIGNILGSNIANILLILGVAAMIYPLTVKKGTVWKEIPFSLLAVLMLAVMVSDVWLDGTTYDVLSRSEALVMLGFFVIFMYYVFGVTRAQGSDGDDLEVKIYHPMLAALMIVTGLIFLFLGGKWIVDGAVAIAQNLGVSEGLIGLTVVAIGTSLPELATSAVAAYKKNVDIAVGNVVGSNIFNIFWILGVSGVISPISFSSKMIFDVGVAVFVTLLLFLFMFVGKRLVLQKWQGAVMVAAYVVYTAILIWRG